MFQRAFLFYKILVPSYPNKQENPAGRPQGYSEKLTIISTKTPLASGSYKKLINLWIRFESNIHLYEERKLSLARRCRLFSINSVTIFLSSF